MHSRPLFVARDSRLVRLVLLLFCLFFGSFTVRADRPADPLLRRLPPDAGLTLAVEDLKTHAAEILASPVYEAFERLPAVVAWRKSDAAAKVEDARRKLEIALDTKWPVLRDGLFGDAVVLCFHLPSDARLDQARGLLLVKPGDSRLLERVVRLMNAVQTADGGLLDVATAHHRGRTYYVRRFGRPERREYYVILPDGIFAWSNSEAAIRGVIDRDLDGKNSLLERPEVCELREGLAARPFVSLLVNPRLVERLLTLAPAPVSEGDKRARRLLDGALKSMLGFAVGLEWRGGLVLHSHEIRDVVQTPLWLKTWVGSDARPDGLARKIPSSAAASAVGTVDLASAAKALRSVLEPQEAHSYELMMSMARGMLLDNDPERTILPRLGPGAVVYVDAPSGEESGTYGIVAAVEIAGGKGDPLVQSSLHNALRMILTLYALDPARQALRLRVETRESGGRRLTSVSGGPTPFVYGFGPGYAVVGTSEKSVNRFDDGSGDDVSALLKSEYAPDAAWYARVDTNRIASTLRSGRSAWIKRLGAEADFDQAVGLLDLFPNLFASMTIDREARSIHRLVALVASTPVRK